MNLNEDNYRQYDLDWFFIAGDKLCHAASAGGKLPGSYMTLLNKYSSLLRTVASMPSVYCVEINPDIDELLGGAGNEIGMNIYLTTFRGMASKGFYSYDRKELGNIESDEYVLVAKPVVSDEQSAEYKKKVEILKDILPQVSELPHDCNDINLIDYINLNSLNNL